MAIQLYRTNVSSYQDSQFIANEKRVLEEISGIKYIQSLQELEKDSPFILISNTHTRPQEIPKNILEKTILLIHPNSGHDNISAAFLKKNHFPIILGNPIRANAVCEYTLSCIFQHFTKVPNHQYWPNSRSWERKLLRDQKVLILGFGHIGKLLHQSLLPLCRSVKVYDPLADFDSSSVEHAHEWSYELAEDINILLVAASLTDSSYEMVGHQILNKLNPENLIINPARGEIINEKELIQYLTKNPKSFCFLDVFKQEPFNPGHLSEIKNINKTAHMAGVYDRLNRDIISFEYIVIKDFVAAFKQDNIKKFKLEYHDCLLSFDHET